MTDETLMAMFKVKRMWKRYHERKAMEKKKKKA